VDTAVLHQVQILERLADVPVAHQSKIPGSAHGSESKRGHSIAARNRTQMEPLLSQRPLDDDLEIRKI
jgi:hypothetical protein